MSRKTVNPFAKILMLVCGVVLVCAVMFFAQEVSEREYASFMLRNTLQEKEVYFNKILDLKGESLKAFVWDYSYWDEMLNFVKTGDKTWAEINLATGLATYKFQAIWVLRPDLSEVYSYNNLDNPALQRLPIKGAALSSLLARDKFPHFFTVLPEGLMEVRGAPVQPSADTGRKSAPQGYLFVGRLWTPETVKEIADLSDCTLSLVRPDIQAKAGGSTDMHEGSVRFSRVLKGWDGQTVMKMDVLSKSNIMTEHANFQRKRAWLLGGSLCGIVVLFALLTAIWIVRPIKSISRSLDLADPSTIESLKEDDTDIGRLAQMAEMFFHQREELERELKEREAAEHQNVRLIMDLQRRSKEFQEFAYIAAHDLQSPVRKVVSFGRLLEKSLKDRLTGEDLENLNFIIEGAKRMEKMNDCLLYYYTVTASGRPLVPVRLSEVTGKVLTSGILAAVERAGGSVSTAGADLWVKADKVQLFELLHNLLENAMKFNVDGSAPELKIFTDVTDEGTIRVSVQDSGIGIDEMYHDKIFKMFYRLDISGKYEGNGIGLAVCRSIVKAMGGDMGLNSVPGKGSTFWFTIERAERPAAESGKEAA
jgi:signal transduction histidine kinase